MRILLISSSPRKGGNSDILCDQFVKGAVEAGHGVEKSDVYQHTACTQAYEMGKQF